MNPRLVQAKRHHVDCGRAAWPRGNRATGNWADAVSGGIGPRVQRSGGPPLANGLVEWVCGDRVANTLSRRSGIVDSTPTTDDGLGSQPIGNTDARGEVCLVHPNHASSDSQAGVLS